MVFRPAMTIVEDALLEHVTDDDFVIPKNKLVKRVTNRARAKLRPKEPRTLDFEVNYLFLNIALANVIKRFSNYVTFIRNIFPTNLGAYTCILTTYYITLISYAHLTTYYITLISYAHLTDTSIYFHITIFYARSFSPGRRRLLTARRLSCGRR